MTRSILSYQQEDSVRLECEIDLERLFSATKNREREREKFEKKWDDFIESGPGMAKFHLSKMWQKEKGSSNAGKLLSL